MKVIVDIPKELYLRYTHWVKTGSSVQEAEEVIAHGIPISEWLSSFNTESAPKCFEAVQKLKMEVKDKCKW